MKKKREIYCEYAFWEAFFEMEERVLRDRSKRKLWDSFYNFLSNNNLFFDFPMQSITEETIGGKNIMALRQEKGGAGMKFIPRKYPKFEDISDDDDCRLNSVFLTTLETSACEKISKRFGVIVFNLSMIFSAEHVYIDNGISFDRANGQNWTYLWGLREKCPSINCCNSLVVVDRYLLYDNNESAFEANLRPIFDALLPISLENDIIFTICIIAENKCRSIEEKFCHIESLIRELRPELNYRLNICDSNRLHDRSIITNNVILTSGAGFDVIGTNEMPLRFTTTSLHFPFLQSDKNEKYLDWINNVLKEEQKCRGYQRNYWGDENKRHHLLDYYYEEPVLPRATFSIGSSFGNLLSQIRATT